MFWILLTILAFIIQLLCWCLVFNRLKSPLKTNINSEKPPVSIIICARNAKHLLVRNLGLFLTQNYPVFELIVVDDNSEDDTGSLIRNLQGTYPDLKYYRNDKTAAGKKQALILGIREAQYEWIALSDADCMPAGPDWLSSMMEKTVAGIKIVLGLAPYHKDRSVLNNLIRFESSLNSMQYLAAAFMGHPYMGIGRNLIYHKSIFDLNHLQTKLAFGDDDLLINAQATAGNTAISLDPPGFIYTSGKKKYKDYFLQRWRHYSAANYYTTQTKMFLILFFASLIAMHFGALALIFKGEFILGIGISAIYYILSWSIYCRKSILLQEEDLCKWFPLLNLMYILHLCIQFPFLFIRKKNW